MKRFHIVISGISTATTLALLRVSTGAAQSTISSGAQAARGVDMPTELFGDGAIFQTIVNTMLFLIGAIAVIMIVFAGFRYVTSGGNAANVTAAKNTILYAIVGIIVAVLSYAAINFVLTTLQGGGIGSTAGL